MPRTLLIITLKHILLCIFLWVCVIAIGEFYLANTYPLTMTKKVNVTGLEIGFPILYVTFLAIRFGVSHLKQQQLVADQRFVDGSNG